MNPKKLILISILTVIPLGVGLLKGREPYNPPEELCDFDPNLYCRGSQENPKILKPATVKVSRTLTYAIEYKDCSPDPNNEVFFFSTVMPEGGRFENQKIVDCNTMEVIDPNCAYPNDNAKCYTMDFVLTGTKELVGLHEVSGIFVDSTGNTAFVSFDVIVTKKDDTPPDIGCRMFRN